ncbi:hypothetical protein TSUD_102160 [Trifolium subterraneum]|uniref:Uncharacterized protein n=1 Tax=Trifolium subterraneum TaxID=3900 RepID=A0A2Z6N539_TRISU|nr:hypothetical protein TSUD_102160 [Trifolium subterraneum]
MRVMAALPLFGVLVSLEFYPVVLWCFRLDGGGGGCRQRSVVVVVVFGSGTAGE